ncbi:uncharacterized protein LOC124471098 [Hypomesus transpacificus]|uniref:uncharacterized protein LOC124471098 n=1 Tax=Hypomesus transpacificus TaxID=137520 RepID=UPI001F082954|nr:uncharacterized protein LOC124471098 [Hypomesus transpacificus]
MADGELLLWNTSDSSPVNSTLHGELTDRLRVSIISKDLYLEIIKVSQSDTGRYRIECRTGSKVTYQKNFTLTVCDWNSKGLFVNGINAELPCDIAVESGLSPTITWFRLTRGTWRTVFVDGSKTLNSGMKDLQGRVQVTQNNSLLISNYTNADGFYFCVALEEKKCGSVVEGLTDMPFYYFRFEKQDITLPCVSFTVDPAGTFWSTPYGTIKADIPSKSPPDTSSPRPQKRGEMYMMDGRENKNYSLVIPSLELNHSGRGVRGQSQL